MTILFFARRFYPYIGGVEKHVMEIGKRLIDQGHRIIVVTEKSSSPPTSPRLRGTGQVIKSSHFAKASRDRSSHQSISGIEIVRIPVGREDRLKKFRIWKHLWELRNLIGQADVIHCHDVFFWYLPFRLLYLRKPVYTTFHGYESYPISKKTIIVRKISEKLSWGNICIGDFMKKWYGTNPTFVSYGAVSLSPITYHLSPRKKDSVLFFGRLDGQTGILEYVRAFEILKKRYKEFELLVVGDGEYKDKINKKVKVVGFQENPEKYFKNYRFAFVSRYLSILEAMAAKRLVVAVYDNPVKEDYLRMTPYAPFIIIEKEPEKIAEKIEYFLNNPQKEKELIDKAYDWVKKKTWEEMVTVYMNLWGKKTTAT